MDLIRFIFLLCLFLEFARAQDLLKELLELPAPPPPNSKWKKELHGEISSFDPFNTPDENSDMQTLVAYWSNLSYSEYKDAPIIPSEKVLKKMKAEIEKDPYLLVSLLQIFKHREEDIEFVKNLYERERQKGEINPYWIKEVKNWLICNSKYFTNELLKLVQESLKETNDYLEGKNELLALAKHDWNKAEPILRTLLADSNKQILQTLARFAFYRKAIYENNESEIKRWRNALKKTVEDKTKRPAARDLAMDALILSGDFPGRDEWYLSLFRDETLHDLREQSTNFTGLITLPKLSPPNKYRSKMLEFLKSNNKSLRTIAARILLENQQVYENYDSKAIKALLPALEDQDWIDEKWRSHLEERIIYALEKIKLPESVPGLIKQLQEKKKLILLTQDERKYEHQEKIRAIVSALGNQGDPKAIPFLRSLLMETIRNDEIHFKETIAEAVIKCNGFSLQEQAYFLEKALQKEVLEENVDSFEDIVGKTVKHLYEDKLEADSELVTLLDLRRKELLKVAPKFALKLREVLVRWKGEAIDSLLLSELNDSSIDREGVLRILARRKELRKSRLNEIYSLRNSNSIAQGISACLLEDGNFSTIKSNDLKVKLAMLACARLIRMRLPITEVAAMTKDKNLKEAAVLYLEVEDSQEARKAIYSSYPNQAYITGARGYFGKKTNTSYWLDQVFRSVYNNYDSSHITLYPKLDKIEKNLRDEILKRKDLTAIYAYNDSYIRIYEDKATFQWKNSEDYYRERELGKEEVENFQRFLLENQVENLGPFLGNCQDECCGPRSTELEFIMLGKNGGRRVFFSGVERISEVPFFADLEKIFVDLRQKPSRIKYLSQDSVPSLKVLFSDDEKKILTVWKNENDFRVLVRNLKEEDQARREVQKMVYEMEERGLGENLIRETVFKNLLNQGRLTNPWQKFASGRLGELVSSPTGFSNTFSAQSINYLSEDALLNPYDWKQRTELFRFSEKEDGIYKVHKNGRKEKISSRNFYGNFSVSSDGNWIVGASQGSLFRINLVTRKETQIPAENQIAFERTYYIPSLSSFLVVAYKATESQVVEEAEIFSTGLGSEIDPAEYPVEYFLLDTQTWRLRPASSKITLFAQQTIRPLQKVSSTVDEFWVAEFDPKEKRTKIGILNAKTQTFKVVLTLPKIKFNSMRMWVDEKEKKVYFAHDGNLLEVSFQSDFKLK